MDKKIVIFDFDGTLTCDSLPKFEILEKCGYSKGLLDIKFLTKVITRIPKCPNIYQALYETILNIISNSGLPLNDETITLGAEKVEFNEGVHEFLSTLKSKGIKSYILSSGVKSYLEKSSIGDMVSGIFATTFSYNLKGYIAGIRFCMSDKRKVNSIKAILRQNNLPENDTSNIIYIGDGITDIHAFTFVKNNGGTAIFVYDDANKKDIESIADKGIINHIVEKKYDKNSELYNIVINKNLIYKLK